MFASQSLRETQELPAELHDGVSHPIAGTEDLVCLC